MLPNDRCSITLHSRLDWPFSGDQKSAFVLLSAVCKNACQSICLFVGAKVGENKRRKSGNGARRLRDTAQ